MCIVIDWSFTCNPLHKLIFSFEKSVKFEVAKFSSVLKYSKLYNYNHDKNNGGHNR